ncbi:hypothetical protein T484DRAFT_1857565, partial [Baffinella frigidus]
QGCTAIYGAAQNGKAAVGGFTPLHVAAMKDHAAVVKALLEAGADTEAKDQEPDGADTEAKDQHGKTPLGVATGAMATLLSEMTAPSQSG